MGQVLRLQAATVALSGRFPIADGLAAVRLAEASRIGLRDVPFVSNYTRMCNRPPRMTAGLATEASDEDSLLQKISDFSEDLFRAFRFDVAGEQASEEFPDCALAGGGRAECQNS